MSVSGERFRVCLRHAIAPQWNGVGWIGEDIVRLVGMWVGWPWMGWDGVLETYSWDPKMSFRVQKYVPKSPD